LTVDPPLIKLVFGDGRFHRLRKFVIKIAEEVPEIPGGYFLLGNAYDLSPDGATFDPYLKLTFTYEEENIPEQIQEKNLYIAYYGHEWVPLDSTVDTGENEVSADVTHFTVFAVMAKLPPPPAPAEFVVSNLAISPAPAEVGHGKEVAITVEVANTGGREGSYLVSLWIDEVLEEAKEVTLAPEAVETIVFTVTRDASSTYSIKVNGLSGSFTVKPVPPPAPTPTPRPVLPVPQPINWWLIGGIIGGMIALGLLVYFLVFRRSRALPK